MLHLCHIFAQLWKPSNRASSHKPIAQNILLLNNECVCMCARAFILKKIKFQPKKNSANDSFHLLFSSSASLSSLKHLSTFHFNRTNWFGIQTPNVNLVSRPKQPKILLLERRAVAIGGRCHCFAIALQNVTYNSESR